MGAVDRVGLRGAIVHLVGRVKEEWVKAVILAVVGSSLTLIAFFYSTTVVLSRNWISRAINLSSEQALAQARQRIGVRALKAIPFVNPSSLSIQYIAVLVGGEEQIDDDEGTKGYLSATILLLRGYHGVYEKIDPALTVTNGYPLTDDLRNDAGLPPVFGVVDIDNDGDKELFAITYTHDSASYQFTVVVYDVVSRRRYSLSAEGLSSETTVAPTFEGDIDAKNNLRQWLTRSLMSYAGAKDN